VVCCCISRRSLGCSYNIQAANVLLFFEKTIKVKVFIDFLTKLGGKEGVGGGWAAVKQQQTRREESSSFAGLEQGNGEAKARLLKK
jgi:hypothetical protein